MAANRSAERIPRIAPCRGGIAAVALLAAAGCNRTITVTRCAVDSDCGDVNTWRCEERTGVCLCRSAAACKEGELCNPAGFCVPRASFCTQNSECPDGMRCDPQQGRCVAANACSTDGQCPTGQICNRATSTCQAGCRTHGDCELGQVCLCKDASGAEVPCECPAVDEVGRLACPRGADPDGGVVTLAPGRCVNDRCGDTSFCKFGDTCHPVEDGGAPQCVNDYDPRYRPYCDNCVYGPGRDTCGVGPNFCLTAFDPRTNQGYTYCGVDCSAGQSCPNGYFCKDIIVVYGRWICGSDADCAMPQARSTVVCTQDADCPNNGICGKDPGAASGFCHGNCYKREGTATGFCSCVIDDDCFQDGCDTVSRTCSVSKRPCDVNGNGCAQKIRCVNFGNRGGCLIGQNCATVDGLTCNDVR